MPQPNGPRKPEPDDLARQIAQRLAESVPPAKPRFAWRKNVVVGRVLSGLIVLSTTAVIVLGIFAGVDWALDRATAIQPEVLSQELASVDVTENPLDPSGAFQTFDLGWLLGTQEGPGSALPLAEPDFVIGVAMPSPTTAPDPHNGAAGSSTTLDSTPAGPNLVTTTQPIPPSTSAGPTSTTTTASVPKPTIPGTTSTTSTTTTTVTTTTTLPTTTTIEATTTTFPDATTTTCGNNGGGKGNCG